MKKWKDTTKGGYKILSIHGPKYGYYVGVVEHEDGELIACTWYDSGNDVDDVRTFNLVPAEPVVVIRYMEFGDGYYCFQGFAPDPKANLKLTFHDGKLVSAEVIK